MRGRGRSASQALIAVFAIAFLSGCTFTAHDVQLSALPQTPTSDAGGGTPVLFRFIDDRDDTNVGHRGAGTMGATITANNLPTFVESRLRAELQNKGFRLVDSGASGGSSVTYRLRSFKFEISTGLFTGTQAATAALAVDARRAGQSYANVYRASDHYDIVAVPDGDSLDSQMNGVLDKVLTQAAADSALDNFLVGR